MSKNNLIHLPGSMRNLRLTELDISENLFEMNDDNLVSICNIQVPSLIELAGQIILIKKSVFLQNAIHL